MQSPFADLRYWIRSASRVVRGLRRPYIVQWVDNDTVHIRHAQINIRELGTFMQHKLKALRAFVDTEILCGISLEELGITCDFGRYADSGDEKTRGYSPLGNVNKDGTLNNADSDKFFDAMLEAGVLGLKLTESGEVIWDKAKSTKWLSAIHKAWSQVFPLCHTTGGLPGRGTEEALFQWMNSAFTRRHLFFKEGTIGLASNYHKGTLSTGIYKYVLRLLPYDLACIIFILLRIVRPVELDPLLQFHIGTNETQEVVEIYKTRLFASMGKAWTSEMLSESLAVWFKEGFQCAMGLQLYRHLAIAISRQHFDYSKEITPMEQALNTQAGHSPPVNQLHYGGEKGGTNNFIADEKYFALVSKGWHKLFGLKTTAIM